MNELAAYQSAFVDALDAEEADFAPSRHAAFDVYRNTTMRGCVDALEDNFPAVACLVGRDWFRSVAALYAEAEPPRDSRLLHYGDTFPAFLAAFGPAAELPYLADVARLDRLWTESYMAADAAAPDWGGLAADALARVVPTIHPALRLFRAVTPAVSIWQASRAGLPAVDDLAWRPECALVARAGMTVQVHAVEASSLAFIDACATGATLAEAAMHTLGIYSDAALDHIFAECLRIGAFAHEGVSHP
ncbi:putative DNA-binding domain-containing protein [Luteibacter sp. CQ10]|uniref:HvfC/BufC family peptide modification chaperone n=1 Tax=Luteibacter sp. CQ10 TaxID=2805821 RepID=UPI0034A4DE38